MHIFESGWEPFDARHFSFTGDGSGLRGGSGYSVTVHDDSVTTVAAVRMVNGGAG